MTTTYLNAIPGKEVCDFCSTFPITASYYAEDFESKPFELKLPNGKTAELTQGSTGGWAACAVCEKLIDANEWENVVSRAITEFYKIGDPMDAYIPREKYAQHLRELYAQLLTKGFRKE